MGFYSNLASCLPKNELAITEADIDEVNAGSGIWLSNSTTSLSLRSGFYIIYTTVTFPANERGKRQVSVMDYSNSKYYAVQSVGATNGDLEISTMYFLRLDKKTTMRLAYYQDSGSILKLTQGKIRAFKICGI